MTTLNLVKIGNSKGIIIPGKIREKCNIGSKVEVTVKENKIIIEAKEETPRKDWKEKLIALNADKDFTPTFMDEINDTSDEDWIW